MKTLKPSTNLTDYLAYLQDMSQSTPAFAVFLAALATMLVAAILSRHL